MYDEIKIFAIDRSSPAELQEQGLGNYTKLAVVKELQKYGDTEELEKLLQAQNTLTFSAVFDEPIGFYLIKCFLETENSIDKVKYTFPPYFVAVTTHFFLVRQCFHLTRLCAIFVKDVQVYKSLQDRAARLHIAKKIYNRFCTSESCLPKKELSVFDTNVYIYILYKYKYENNNNNNNNNNDTLSKKGYFFFFKLPRSENGQKENMSRALEELMTLDYKCNESHLRGPSSQTRGASDIICSDNDDNNNNKENANSGNKSMLKKRFNPDMHKVSITATASSQPTASSNISGTDGTLSLLTEESNIIGVHGRPIERLKKQIEEKAASIDLFDEIVNEVVQELTLDVFPRFCMSKWYKLYIKCKSIEKSTVSTKDFHQLHTLGRGAFGSVHACKKKSTGKLYAMKQLNKRRIQETESAIAVNAERNFLALMKSRFVTTLKYAFMDDNTLFLMF
ncbi:hypothetical protein RFI_03999 [Reticulomyxa filosa]|uniref:Protein kinase domain-containing protein n=1 Tax=Reticulomyxa filosa TaxID=46433 RepID=X6P3J2_RETFI|nr:hypothetical protein RFI_03999 [Reticulomyxa filosa]|eukprot:ETO33110.1 hypothetical protein RFI_03999 [Reticulomyxa filosa]